MLKALSRAGQNLPCASRKPQQENEQAFRHGQNNKIAHRPSRNMTHQPAAKVSPAVNIQRGDKTMKTQKKQAGFTLIELIVVIVILGILAATALPRFIDMSGDARAASIRGIGGAVSSAMNIAYGRASLDGQTAAAGSITVEGTAITLAYGYPDVAGIAAMVVSDPAPVGGVWTLATNCTVTYTAATGDGTNITAPANVAVDVSGC